MMREEKTMADKVRTAAGHIKEAEMLLEDMQRPVEMRYAGAQAQALIAIAKILHAQMEEGEE